MEALKLDPYQGTGARHLAGRKQALLADSPGLGKTPQAIRAASAHAFERTLIICPAIGRPMWKTMWPRWWNHPFVAPRVPQVLVKLEDVPAREGPVACSFEYAMRRTAALIAAGRWDRIIVDEAHNLGGLTAIRAHQILGKDGLIHHADGFWLLTGTPARNHPGELWSLMKVSGVTSLTYGKFVDRYCTTKKTPYGFKITGGREENAAELREILEGSGWMLRRLVEDVALELPPIVYEDLVVEPNPVDLRCVSDFVTWTLPDDRTADFHREVLEPQKKLLEEKLLQYELGEQEWTQLESLAVNITQLLRFVGLQKVHAIRDLVTAEYAAGAWEKMVIFGKFRAPLNSLWNRLADWSIEKFDPATRPRPMMLWGGMTPEKKENVMKLFRESEQHPWLLASIDACKELVDFTAANHGIFMERSFVPTDNEQAAARLRRRGQTKPVFMRVAGLVDSADGHLAHIIRRKMAALAPLFGAREARMFEAAVDYCGV